MKRLFRSSLALLALGLSFAPAMAQVPYAAGDWPQWRGPNRDGISLDKGLLKEWPKDGPPLLWQVDTVGVGYSSIAIKGGRIYTQGDINGVEHIMCLDAKDGKTLWQVQPAPVAAVLTTKLDNEVKQLDRNKDGKIDELEAIAKFGWDWNKYDRATGGDLEAIAAKRSAALLKELDKNNDGQLTYAEAGNALRDTFERIDSQVKGADENAIATARTAEHLKALDKDGDGRLSKDEVKGSALERHFGRIEVKDPATQKGGDLLSAEELTAAFIKFEAGRDGVISAAELTAYYVKNKIAGDGELSAEELRGAIGGYRNGMGDGPRGTPTVDGDRVYVEGGNGDVACLEAATGKTIWHVNLRADFGGGTPGWGYSESPLIVDDMVVVTPGGKGGTLLTLNKFTGKVIWQSGGVTEGAHYSSPEVATIDGVRQIVQFANKSVFGVTLNEGKPLWSYAAPANGTANCCSPIIDGNLVFASSSYGTGGGLTKVTSAGSTQQAEEVYFEKKMACHHGGIVKVGDFMYSNGGGALICMNFATGDIAWQNRASGKGSLCVADGMLYLLGEGHELALAEVNTEKYVEHGKFKLDGHGKPAWAHPIVTGGRMYIRDQESLRVYDVRAK
ncbi:outer membrane protein assembly factor BamB family protein [Anatilimnocola floriformis]|uniref:outer membrane protein assembly factor BamB family protein n=1 Tax=Anatilimnocola floriformis TaxID=2948575 RepID=UPI0020C49668|nr:PQQ-binding-like beta-propeller repeat protein [Anatilimnocola floriformis]